MAAHPESTSLAVIGAGPGGYAAAFLAADLGIDVTLIDPGENPGGVCLYRGCIPSKALLHIAKVITEAREVEEWGVSFGKPSIDSDKIREWKNGVVESLTSGLGQLSERRKINYVRGTARFVDNRTLEIKTADAGNETLRFEHAIIATGSRPAAVPGLAIDSPRVLDSTGALMLDDIPRSLLVVGGGYIGLELGSVYAALGSKVSVVEMMPALLPGADKDMVRILHKKLESRFESIMLETTVTGMTEQKTGVKVGVSGSDGEKEHRYEKVLVAVGRRPNSEGLGLENTAVVVTDRGFIEVDPSRRTNDPSIFAIGDVIGEPMLAHKASHEGRVAAEVLAGRDVVFEPRAIPAVVFTDPEIAWCGLTETEATESKRDVEVSRFPWAASGRAKTLGKIEGTTKIIADSSNDRVLGVGIVGAGAGDLIAEAVLAIEMGATVKDIALTIHPHPTLSETIMESAEVYFGESSHLYRPKRR